MPQNVRIRQWQQEQNSITAGDSEEPTTFRDSNSPSPSMSSPLTPLDDSMRTVSDNEPAYVSESPGSGSVRGTRRKRKITPGKRVLTTKAKTDAYSKRIHTLLKSCQDLSRITNANVVFYSSRPESVERNKKVDISASFANNPGALATIEEALDRIHGAALNLGKKQSKAVEGENESELAQSDSGRPRKKPKNRPHPRRRSVSTVLSEHSTQNVEDNRISQQHTVATCNPTFMPYQQQAYMISQYNPATIQPVPSAQRTSSLLISQPIAQSQPYLASTTPVQVAQPGPSSQNPANHASLQSTPTYVYSSAGQHTQPFVCPSPIQHAQPNFAFTGGPVQFIQPRTSSQNSTDSQPLQQTQAFLYPSLQPGHVCTTPPSQHARPSMIYAGGPPSQPAQWGPSSYTSPHRQQSQAIWCPPPIQPHSVMYTPLNHQSMVFTSSPPPQPTQPGPSHNASDAPLNHTQTFYYHPPIQSVSYPPPIQSGQPVAYSPPGQPVVYSTPVQPAQNVAFTNSPPGAHWLSFQYPPTTDGVLQQPIQHAQSFVVSPLFPHGHPQVVSTGAGDPSQTQPRRSSPPNQADSPQIHSLGD